MSGPADRDPAALPGLPPIDAKLRPEPVDEGDKPLRQPPSYGKLVLVILSCLLMIPLGIGTATVFPDCDGFGDAFAVVHGEDVDRSLLVYQLVREEGFDAGRNAAKGELEARFARALDRVVAVGVLAHRAAKQGIKVSDQELAAFLKDPVRNGDFPFFATEEGAFDAKRYQQVVGYGFRLGTKRYEDYKRQEILAARALAQLGPAARGEEVRPGLGATEAWLFHPFLARRLGARAPMAGPQVWALVDEARQAGQVRIDEAKLRPAAEPETP